MDAFSPLISQRVQGLVAAGVAGGFEGGQRAVAEARQKEAGIVDADRLHFSRKVVLATLDEGLGGRGNLGDAAVQPHRGIDAVRQQIAGDTAASNRDVEAPEALAALRQIGGDGPVLQKLRAVVKDAAQASLVDQLLGERHGGNAAVVVPHHVAHTRGFHRFHHGFRLGGVAAERLFAHHHLAGAGRGDGDFGMRVVGAGDIDQVDIRRFDNACANRFRPTRIPTWRRSA